MSKIGFILKGYPRLSETFIAQEIYLLEQRGFEIDIYSMRGPREKIRHPVHEKIKAKVVYIPEYIWESFAEIFWANVLVAFTRPIYLALLPQALWKSLRTRSRSPIKRFLQAGWLIQREDLGHTQVKHLHSHFIHTPTELTYYLSKITGLTYSISAHAKDIYTSTPAEIRERVQASEFLMTCTEFNFHKIREFVGPEHAGKVNQVYHGVSLSAFQPELEPDYDFPQKRLLTIARLVEKKGFEDVFAALKLLKDKGLRLHYDIYGDGELKKSLLELRDRLGLESQVTLHGAVSQPIVLKSYREGGVFILASRETENGDRDGIPNSMAEAMSMAMPVLATNVSGIPEILEHNLSGLLVAQRAPAEIAAGLERLFSEKGLAAKLGIEARKKVTRVFDADRCIDVCEKLLKPYSKR